MSQMTQAQMFYAASRNTSEVQQQFMAVMASDNPLTAAEIRTLAAKRPALWSQFLGFADQLDAAAAKNANP
jgi:hypothetical protein